MTNPPPDRPTPEYVRRICLRCGPRGHERIDDKRIRCEECGDVHLDNKAAQPRKPEPTDAAQRRLMARASTSRAADQFVGAAYEQEPDSYDMIRQRLRDALGLTSDSPESTIMDAIGQLRARAEAAEQRAADLALQLDKAKVELREAEQRHRKSDWARERAQEDWRAERARADAAERRLAELAALVERVRDGRSEGSIADLLVWLDRQAREGGQVPGPDETPEQATARMRSWFRENAVSLDEYDAAKAQEDAEEREGQGDGQLTAESVVRDVQDVVDDSGERWIRPTNECVALVEQYARQHAEPLAARVAELVPALADRDAELERERLRLAACLEAAEGRPVRNGMLAEYDSDALRAIELLRQYGEINVAAVKAQAEKLAKLRAEHTDVLAERDAMQSLATQNGREVERLRAAPGAKLMEAAQAVIDAWPNLHKDRWHPKGLALVAGELALLRAALAAPKPYHERLKDEASHCTTCGEEFVGPDKPAPAEPAEAERVAGTCYKCAGEPSLRWHNDGCPRADVLYAARAESPALSAEDGEILTRLVGSPARFAERLEKQALRVLCRLALGARKDG